MIIVSDATPIITLSKIGRLDLLQKLFENIMIPKAVYYDLTSNTQFQEEAKAIDNAEYIKVVEIGDSKAVELLRRAMGLNHWRIHFLMLACFSFICKDGTLRRKGEIVIDSKNRKGITAKEVFARCTEVKKKLWGGNFWSSGYYVAMVSEHGNEEVIANYVKSQGDEYKKLFRNKGMEGQMSMFNYM